METLTYLRISDNLELFIWIISQLLEAINVTLKDYENGGREKSGSALLITRKHDDTQNKLAEYEQNDLRIGLKVFLNKEDPNNVLDSIEKGKLGSWQKEMQPVSIVIYCCYEKWCNISYH